MNKRTIGATIASALLVTGLAGGAVALASGGDSEGTVTGPDADRAVAAALAETGATKANAVERDSEKGAVWEVEVTNADGSISDVRLDANFKVIAVEKDSEADHNESGPETGHQD